MNKRINLLIPGLAASFLILGSCSEQDHRPDFGEARYLEVVTAEYATRAEEEGLDPEDPAFPLEDDNIDATNLLDDGLSDGDILYFSQLVTGKLVPFQPFNGEDTDFPDGYPNLYQYVFKTKDYKPTWDDQPLDYGGYNFFPENASDRLDWDVVKHWGINNNGFALFAMFFPVDNVFNSDFKVFEDQTDLESLRRSNFIAAYHSSSSAFTRLRFKLYHLMAYLKVTLYVPVYNDDDRDAADNKIRTGYPADALQSAQVLNVIPNFNINWYANRSSDDAPACSAVSTEERTNISMYIPPLDANSYPTTNGLPPIVKIKTADFYSPNDPKYDPDAYDTCWEITLSALFPAGQDYTNPQQTWTNGNILRFNLRQNIGEVPKRFIFNGNSNMGLISGGDAMNISQGHIQHLNLYLPRDGEAAILLGATVQKWQEGYNDNMGLTQDPPKPSQQANKRP